MLLAWDGEWGELLGSNGKTLSISCDVIAGCPCTVPHAMSITGVYKTMFSLLVVDFFP